MVMLQFKGKPGTGFEVFVLEALQLPRSAPSPLLLTIQPPGGQSLPVCGSQVLSRWYPRRRSPSQPLYILQRASGWLDGHNSYCVVGAFVWISLYSEAHNYTALPCYRTVPCYRAVLCYRAVPCYLAVTCYSSVPPYRAVPTLGPQVGVRNIPWKLQEVRKTPALSVVRFVPHEAGV